MRWLEERQVRAADVLFPWANLVRSAFLGVIGAKETTFVNGQPLSIAH